MSRYAYLFMCLVFGVVPSFAGTSAQVLAGEDGWFHVEGEPVYIKGVCFFENHSVEGRFERSSLEVLDHEFARIKAAGFNAIRSQLRSEELALARKHGLLVLQGANHLCFSREYLAEGVIREHAVKTKEILSYSKGHDNILAFLIDNEPNVQEGIFRQGEPAINGFYRQLTDIVHSASPSACVSMASFPPAAFLDDSILGAQFINLYPWYPSSSAAGYADYLNWVKRRHAVRKPLVVSEYGWTFSQGEAEMNRAIEALLDAQIRAGASGGFFFTWRTFGPEAQDDNLWMGLVPNEGRAGDYTNAARSVADVLRTYFEAVVIEPLRDHAYSGELPVRVYGSDRTHSMEVLVGRQRISLQKTGRYWWEARLALPPGLSGRREVVIESRDQEGGVLARKTVWIAVNQARPVWTVKIVSEVASPASGSCYKARITVADQDGQPVRHVRIPLLVNETGKDLFGGIPFSASTDENGVCLFTRENLVPGYFTLMAGLGMSDEDKTVQADVETVRVEP